MVPAFYARAAWVYCKNNLSLFENRGIFSEHDINRIQSSVQTVASELVEDMRGLQLGELNSDKFMAKYGHSAGYIRHYVPSL